MQHEERRNAAHQRDIGLGKQKPESTCPPQDVAGNTLVYNATYLRDREIKQCSISEPIFNLMFPIEKRKTNTKHQGPFPRDLQVHLVLTNHAMSPNFSEGKICF